MNLQVAEFVTMPNHFHAIIIIGQNKFNYSWVTRKNRFSSQSKNLASIVRGFKTGVTVRARQIDPFFGWQSRYYDHIIRDSEDYQRIAEYITTNPTRWNDDKFYTHPCQTK